MSGYGTTYTSIVFNGWGAFCSSCRAPVPEGATSWRCPCGAGSITTNTFDPSAIEPSSNNRITNTTDGDPEQQR